MTCRPLSYTRSPAYQLCCATVANLIPGFDKTLDAAIRSLGLEAMRSLEVASKARICVGSKSGRVELSLELFFMMLPSLRSLLPCLLLPNLPLLCQLLSSGTYQAYNLVFPCSSLHRPVTSMAKHDPRARVRRSRSVLELPPDHELNFTMRA